MIYLMLYTCISASCNPDIGGVLDEPIDSSKPPTEDPVISPSIDDLLKIKINEEDMIIGTNSWNAIAYGNGKYVAVGSSGYVTTSQLMEQVGLHLFV